MSTRELGRASPRCSFRFAARTALLILLAATPAAAQFSSTSTGADGALSIAPGLGDIDFDPTGLDVDGDNVFHFTTIDIGAGTTVRLRDGIAGIGGGRPVVWLASGDVTVAGIIDLNGAPGHDGIATPVFSEPGAGGFGGGPGGVVGSGGSGPGGASPQPGNGFGGAGGHINNGGGSPTAVRGTAYGSVWLLPLLGGSGGAGGGNSTGTNVCGGGAGGGAILVATSGTLNLSGTIRARGGIGGSPTTNCTGNAGGGGSGGAVRLMSSVLTGAGTVDVNGAPNTNNSFNGSAGRGRVETFENSSTLSLLPTNTGSYRLSTPGVIFPPITQPTVRVTAVGGVAVTATPTGSFTTPDVVIDSAAPVSLDLAATFIPPGTTVTIVLHFENATSVTVTSTALAGTIDASTATAGLVTLQPGLTRIFAKANW